MSIEREALVAVVELHGFTSMVNSRDRVVQCACGEWLYVGPFDDVVAGYPNHEREERARAEHIVDALIAALGLLTEDRI